MKQIKCPTCKKILLKYDHNTECKNIYVYCKQCRKKENVSILNVLETGIITTKNELYEVLKNLKIEHDNKDIDFETIEILIEYPDGKKNFIAGYKIIVY